MLSSSTSQRATSMFSLRTPRVSLRPMPFNADAGDIERVARGLPLVRGADDMAGNDHEAGGRGSGGGQKIAAGNVGLHARFLSVFVVMVHGSPSL